MKPTPTQEEPLCEEARAAYFGTHFVGPDRVAVQPTARTSYFPGQERIQDSLPEPLRRRVAELKAMQTKKQMY